MAQVEIKSAFVEDTVGSPVFVLKVAEPHSRKDDAGNWQTVSRTFFDVKVSRDSGIDLAQFAKGDRVSVRGSQRTEVREHEGKKFYTLVVWADSVVPLESRGQQAPAQQPQQSDGWANPAQSFQTSAPF